MSLLVYETLALQPDFTTAPAYGIDDERETNNSPGGTSFAAWAGTTDRVLRFDFQTMATEEWRILREFADLHGGRAKAFFMPSWQHDFELAEDASPGDALLVLAGHWFDANVTENRPDTLGRVLFTLNHLGQFAVHEVVGFSEDGGNDVVALNTPITTSMQGGRTMVGFCYLCRLATDALESDHLSTDHARITLGMRNVRQTRRLNQTEAAEGVAFGSLKANQDIVATDADPLVNNLRSVEALGPFIYGAPQTLNFQSDWHATLNIFTNLVTLYSPGGVATVLPHYNAPGAADQIALTFDAASKAVLAWGLEGRVTIAWVGGGEVIQRLSFTGLSPVAFNTYGIDSTVDAGSATVAIFYLKRQDATIYYRTAAESYATERRYCNSPLAPLRLHFARRLESRLELVGMDASHRLARWRSETYLTPPEIQVMSAGFVEEVGGQYRSIAVIVPELELMGAGFDPLVVGDYREIRVVANAPDEKMGAGFAPLVVGDYREIRVVGNVPDEKVGSGFSTTVSGSYTLVAKMANAPDEKVGAGFATTISGTYAP